MLRRAGCGADVMLLWGRCRAAGHVMHSMLPSLTAAIRQGTSGKQPSRVRGGVHKYNGMHTFSGIFFGGWGAPQECLGAQACTLWSNSGSVGLCMGACAGDPEGLGRRARERTRWAWVQRGLSVAGVHRRKCGCAWAFTGALKGLHWCTEGPSLHSDGARAAAGRQTVLSTGCGPLLHQVMAY